MNHAAPAAAHPRAAALTVVGGACALAAAVAVDAGTSVVAPIVLVLAAVAALSRMLFRWPTVVAALVLLIFLVPIKRYRLPANLPFELEPYRIAVALVVLLWVAALLVDPHVRLRRTVLDAPMLLLPLAAVASIGVNAAVISRNGLDTEAVKALSFLLSFVLVFYVVVSVVRTRREVEAIVRVLVAGGALVALAAIVESRTGYNAFDHLSGVLPVLQYQDPASFAGLDAVYLSRAGRMRVFASAQHPIALAAALVTLLPLALYLAFRTQRRRWWVAAVLLVLGMLTTVSRTGVVMIVVVGLALLRWRPADMRRLAPLIVPGLVFVYFALPNTLGSFYSAFFPKGGIVAEQTATVEGRELSGANLTEAGRLARIGPSLHEFAQRPLFGEGMGSRVVSALDQNQLDAFRLAGVQGATTPNAGILDDQWLTTLLETGAVGTLAWLWLFSRSIRRLRRLARSDPGPDGWLAAALAAALVSFAVGMLTFDVFSFVQATFVLFFLLAVGAVLLRLTEPGYAATSGELDR